MLDFPVRLLVIGYGLAALLAVWIHASFGLLAAGLSFWLGGPLVVCVLAATPWLNRPFLGRGVEVAEGEDEALAAQLRRWEADRLAESAKGSGSRAGRAG